MKVIGRLRDALIVVVCLGGMVAVGVPPQRLHRAVQHRRRSVSAVRGVPAVPRARAAPSPAASSGLRGEADTDVGLRGRLGVCFHRRPDRVELVLRRPRSPCLHRRPARIRGRPALVGRVDRGRVVGRGASSSTSPINETTRAGSKAANRRAVSGCRNHRAANRLAARTPGSKATEASKAAPAPTLNYGS